MMELCYLEVLKMDNGEIIHQGETIGYVTDKAIWYQLGHNNFGMEVIRHLR